MRRDLLCLWKPLLFLTLLLSAGCAPRAEANTPAPTLPATVNTVPSQTPPAAPTASASPTPSASLTPAATPTAVWQMAGPGKVLCPILLYHHIAIPQTPSDYYVTPDNFRAQMQALKDWGYTPIPISLLVRSLRKGAPLPPRPVVISFDDGDISVYENAYPIMNQFGFSGINYLVTNYLNTPGYMSAAQIQTMAKSGWEVGSHSISHRPLPDIQNALWEMQESRVRLEAELGLPAATFAYPFGTKDTLSEKEARQFYEAAVGLGASVEQSVNNLYYLWRRPVSGQWNVETFGSFLPWHTAP